VQNVVRGLILLIAIVFDRIVNPRDEQTAQQGDIENAIGLKKGE
jgi:ribose transport system permease protein